MRMATNTETRKIMTKPLPVILDEIEDSIRLADEAAKNARQAATEAQKAGEKAAKEAALEVRKAGDKAIEEASRTANARISKIEESINAINQNIAGIHKSIESINLRIDNTEESIRTTNEHFESSVISINKKIDSIEQAIKAVNEHLSRVEATADSGLNLSEMLKSTLIEFVAVGAGVIDNRLLEKIEDKPAKKEPPRKK